MPQQIDVPGMGVVEFPDGMSDDQITAAIKQNMPQPTSTAADVAKSAGIGVARGGIGLLGLPGDIINLAGKGAQYLVGKLPMTDQQRAAYNQLSDSSLANKTPTSGDITKAVEGYTGEFYKPQTTAGKYAQSVGEMVPGVMTGPGGVMRKAGIAIGSGVGSEGAGELAQKYMPSAEPYARVAGAIVGGAAPDIARKLVTPIPVSPERQRLLDVLDQEGVTSITAGQKTGNKALQYAESILGDAPLSGQQTSRIQQEGQRQFTEAAMRRAGAGPNAAPEVLADNSQRLGRNFEDIAARNAVTGDSQFVTDFGNTLREYDKVLPSAQKKIVGDLATDIANRFTGPGGTMAGVDYQAARSRLSRMANNARANDPDFADALRGLRNSLDSAFKRSVTPEDSALLDVTRRQYGAQKILEKAASRAGEATAEGQIVPANLRNLVAVENRGAYARGQGEFSDLARAGAGVMAPLPNSGTAQRNLVTALATGGGGAVGALSGGLGTAAGAVGGMAAPGVIGRLLMSKLAQNYLGNNLMRQLTSDEVRAAQIARLLNVSQVARQQFPALGK